MNTELFNQLTPKVIGRIAVDAGAIWIGDPCYVLHKEINPPESIGNSIDEFFGMLGNDSHKSFGFDANHEYEGLGVLTCTKHGDGMFNVIGFYEEGSTRPSCVMVDFHGVFRQ